MKEQYLKSIYAVVSEIPFGESIERTRDFTNQVSQYAYDNFGLNAAATPGEGDALINALDEYFN